MTTKKKTVKTAKLPVFSYQYEEIGPRLKELIDAMESVGGYMEFYGGFGEMGQHGRELLGAAKIARQWLTQMKKKHTKRKHSKAD